MSRVLSCNIFIIGVISSGGVGRFWVFHGIQEPIDSSRPSQNWRICNNLPPFAESSLCRQKILTCNVWVSSISTQITELVYWWMRHHFMESFCYAWTFGKHKYTLFKLGSRDERWTVRRFSVEAQHLKFDRRERQIEYSSLNITQYIRDLHHYIFPNRIIHSSNTTSKVSQILTQNFLDSGEEFMRFVEWTILKYSFQIPEKPEIWRG
jgi:hypothetical protein